MTLPLRQRLNRLLPYFRAGRLGLVVAVIGSLFGAASEAGTAWLMKPLLDQGFSGDRLPLWAVPAALIGLFVVRGAAGYVSEFALAWAAQHGIERLRRDLFVRLTTAETSVFTRNNASSLTNMLVYEAQNGVGLLIGAVIVLLKDSLTLVALLASLLWMNWQLTLIVAALLPSIGFVMRGFAPRVRRFTLQMHKAMDELAYVVEENVLAWRVVRLHDAAADERMRFERSSLSLRRLLLKSVAAGSAISALSQILAACALAVVIAVALRQSGPGGMTVGSFVAFVTAAMMLIQPIKRLSDVTTPITRGLTSLERGTALLHDTPSEVSGGHAPERARGEIELRGVALRYREGEPPALDGVDLRVRPGETVALVGPSGAGKSSLIHLLPRFIEPTDGQLLLDGVPVSQWDIRALRRQFALVSQDVVLFNDTIAANVALGDTATDRADPARVRAALKAANLLDFVETLPQGVATGIGHNGQRLSGGQRQRLAIARAIYKDAPVLILDEATSALDTESERAVQEALERLMQDRTTLVIAHRLSTIQRADRIVTLEAGRIAEQGTHAQLLAAGGLYARLNALQQPA